MLKRVCYGLICVFALLMVTSCSSDDEPYEYTVKLELHCSKYSEVRVSGVSFLGNGSFVFQRSYEMTYKIDKPEIPIRIYCEDSENIMHVKVYVDNIPVAEEEGRNSITITGYLPKK